MTDFFDVLPAQAHLAEQLSEVWVLAIPSRSAAAPLPQPLLHLRLSLARFFGSESVDAAAGDTYGDEAISDLPHYDSPVGPASYCGANCS